MTDNEHIIKLLLTALRLPGRLNAEQAAVLLGFPTHDIPVLIRKGLLHPLVKSAPRNSVKWFAAVEIEEMAKDKVWLSKASATISQGWREANQARSRTQRVEGVNAVPADQIHAKN